MTSIVQFLINVFAFVLIFAAAGTAIVDKTNPEFLRVCMDLEYVLAAIVGSTGVFYPSFPILVLKRDIYKPVCMTIVLGFMVASMSLSKFFLTERKIRLIQAVANAAACLYLVWAWGDREDEKTKAQRDTENIPGAYVPGPLPRRYAKPKSLRQREVASHANQ